jgi:hypothetical protein
MTTIFEEQVTCAVCGCVQTVQEIGSTSSFGEMDLDTRVPPLRRPTMSLWVHESSECGYMAPELGEAVEGAARCGTRRVTTWVKLRRPRHSQGGPG